MDLCAQRLPKLRIWEVIFVTLGGHAEKVKIVLLLKRELDFEGSGRSVFRRFWGLFRRPRSRHLSRGTFGDFV